ncbi:MAG: hypothetical protein KGJ23_05100 [Euryarchaeota archaeon]|nr:hypothetical protein [Euryarchaeota archaeon]MDE1835976.1 hypothetical protein [Euryarchaeota archaeon]MDE1882067.1 hypothetical protein [Euryarchaeota archaeon]MDE2044345.1 hypothetical protein [Thermoplasmata archaeon]
MTEQFKFGWRPTVEGLLAHAEGHFIHVRAAYAVRPVTKIVSEGDSGAFPVTISEPEVPPRSIQLSTAIETKHILEDLRSVFDHSAVYLAREVLLQPVIAKTNSMLGTDGASFPISADEEGWKSEIGRIPWNVAGPKTLAFLQSFQPFVDPPKNGWLRVLHNLVNENKHSSLTEFFVQPSDDRLSFRRGEYTYSLEVLSLTIPSAKLARDGATRNPVPDAWTFFDEAFAGTRKFIEAVAAAVPELRKESRANGGKAV